MTVPFSFSLLSHPISSSLPIHLASCCLLPLSFDDSNWFQIPGMKKLTFVDCYVPIGVAVSPISVWLAYLSPQHDGMHCPCVVISVIMSTSGQLNWFSFSCLHHWIWQLLHSTNASCYFPFLKNHGNSATEFWFIFLLPCIVSFLWQLHVNFHCTGVFYVIVRSICCLLWVFWLFHVNWCVFAFFVGVKHQQRASDKMLRTKCQNWVLFDILFTFFIWFESLIESLIWMACLLTWYLLII
jgi:hypothetical protein